jgi:metal-dependent amidase/aminoacylase/carboxypeptidase family protein
MIGIRRDLHQHPELDFDLHRTAEKVEEHLHKLGISSERYATTGIVAPLEGDLPGPCLLVRGDMDALPIQDPLSVANSRRDARLRS